MKHIRLPLTEADIAALQAGDEVLLSGPLSEADLIELLAQSVLSGFRIHI